MKVLKKYEHHVRDELCGALEYAERSIEHRACGDSTVASKYKDMAKDELKHADFLYEEGSKLVSKMKESVGECDDLFYIWESLTSVYAQEKAKIEKILSL